MTVITLDILKCNIDRFLVFKRDLGHPYQRGEAALRCFMRYAQKHAKIQRASNNLKIDFQKTLEKWLTRNGNRKPVTVANELGVLRQLCLYCQRRHPGFYIPEQALAPEKESSYSPYVFSHKEVSQLLNAAGRYNSRTISAGILRTFLLILYCTGLRLGEAVRLHLSDVNLNTHEFFIRESKGRARLIPFREDLAQEITAYLKERKHITKTNEQIVADTLFVSLSGNSLTTNSVSCAIVQLLRQQGLKPAKGRVGPRPFDFRHAFAVHRLTEWYHQGVDIHTRLPWLSAYMGHANILGTEVYLHATPELLQFASERFENRFKHPGKVS